MKEHLASEIKSVSESFSYVVFPDHKGDHGAQEGGQKWRKRERGGERWEEKTEKHEA